MNYADEDPVPSEQADAQDVADEQFVHGLLETARLDDEQTKRQRMAHVVAGIGGDASHLASPRSSTSPAVRILDRPGIRRAVGFLTAAAAIAVVAIILATTDRRSASEVVASLSRQRAVDQQWVYSAITDGGVKLAGKWSSGDQGERLLALTVWDKATRMKADRGCLVLRAADHSVTAQSDGKRPRELRGWPVWLRSDRLAAPLRSPREWLVATTKTHAFGFDSSQHLVGTRRDEVSDSLVPDRIDVWLSEDGGLSLLELAWSPIALKTPDDKTAHETSRKALRWFDGLDTNRDGTVNRTEAGDGWSRFSSMGFEDVRAVSKSEFAAAIGTPSGHQATELLFGRPDTTRSQPPRQLMFKAAPLGSRPTWLFELEVFRRR